LTPFGVGPSTNVSPVLAKSSLKENGDEGGDGRLSTVPSTVSGPLPSPTSMVSCVDVRARPAGGIGDEHVAARHRERRERKRDHEHDDNDDDGQMAARERSPSAAIAPTVAPTTLSLNP